MAARDEELHATALDTTEAEKELGWKPTVDLAEGIRAHDPLALRHSRARAARPGRCVIGAQMFSHEDRTNGRSKDQHNFRLDAGTSPGAPT